MKAAEAPVMEVARDNAAKAVAPMMEAVEEEGAQAVMERAPEVIMETAKAEPNLALWFLFGCVFVIILVIIFELIKAKKKGD